MGKKKYELTYIWKDRKRTFLGLPWSFTKYRLTEEKLLVETGFFSIRQEETRLYRIMDMTLERSFGQRLLGLGTIVVRSSDKTTPVIEIKRIKNSSWVKETLSELVEKERVKKRVSGREIMADAMDDVDAVDDGDNDQDYND